MLDALLARPLHKPLDAMGARFSGAWLALSAFVVSLAAVPLIVRQFYWIALAVFVLGRILAAIAAHGSKEYPPGPVLDVVAFAVLPFGFALGDPTVALAAVLMMFGLSVQSAVTLRFGRGFIGETELVIAFAVACLFPQHFGIVAYVTSVLCSVSASVQLGARR